MFFVSCMQVELLVPSQHWQRRFWKGLEGEPQEDRQLVRSQRNEQSPHPHKTLSQVGNQRAANPRLPQRRKPFFSEHALCVLRPRKPLFGDGLLGRG